MGGFNSLLVGLLRGFTVAAFFSWGGPGVKSILFYKKQHVHSFCFSLCPSLCFFVFIFLSSSSFSFFSFSSCFSSSCSFSLSLSFSFCLCFLSFFFLFLYLFSSSISFSSYVFFLPRSLSLVTPFIKKHEVLKVTQSTCWTALTTSTTSNTELNSVLKGLRNSFEWGATH